MRRRLVALASLAATTVSAAGFDEAGWRPIESRVISDETEQTRLIVEERAGDDESPRLRLALPNHQSFRIGIPGGGLERLAAAIQAPTVSARNLIESSYVFSSPELDRP